MGVSKLGCEFEHVIDLLTGSDKFAHKANQPYTFAYDSLWHHKISLIQTMKDLYGSRRLDSFGGSYGWSVRYRQIEDYDEINIHTLSEYLDAFESNTIRLPYLRHLSVNRAMRDLRGYIKYPKEFASNWVDHPLLDRFSGPEFFIGQAGTTFGHVHQDQAAVHVGFVQLQGEKEFVVFPPEDSPYLYKMSGREFPYQLRNSKVSYKHLNDVKKFPLLRKSSPIRIRLNAGQAMLLPANWWHTTRNISDSIGYSVRIINSSNFLQSLGAHVEGLPRLFQRKLKKLQSNTLRQF
jgi:hypothetical protein